MKTSSWIRKVATPCFFLIFTMVYWPGMQGHGIYGHGMYDPETVETISGEVVLVEKIAKSKRHWLGTHLKVKTASETILVHLGPSSYLEEKGFEVKKSDQVVVTGSRVIDEGEPVIIASEIKKGSQVLRLRDRFGHPLWRKGMQ